MKRLLIAILALLPSAVNAAPSSTALMCLFKPFNLRFNLLTKDEQDVIQWESKPFQAVVATFEKNYLTVKQYGSTATFKAVIDIKIMKGYGGIFPFSGDPTEGEIICAVD